MKVNLVLISLLIVMCLVLVYREVDFRGLFNSNPSSITEVVAQIEPSITTIPTREIKYKNPPAFYMISQKLYEAQLFNNCGPATLSMALSYNGMDVSQVELGEILRPYQNPTGDNDDKSVILQEFIPEVEKRGLLPYYRVNGDVELLKTFVANDIPVMVRTWLSPNEDIGHFKLVRGYDDSRSILLQDDSYQGPNLELTYDEFDSMWQPFNYQYMVIVSSDKKDLVEAILGDSVDSEKAYEDAVLRAERELKDDSNNPYPVFNLSSSYYHLGLYEKSVNEFERIENSLPSRMLWYQIEPIYAYGKLQDKDRVFLLTENIINNHNRGFSELYYLRGLIYKNEGYIEGAREEFQTALYYNKNFKPAMEELEKLN